MYFGTYLVEKKIISESQMIEALCTQMETLPSLLRVLWKNEIITEKQLGKSVEKGINEKKGLLDVLLEDHLLNVDSQKNALDIQNKEGLSFGQCLLKLGHIVKTDLDEALEKYLNESENLLEKSSNFETNPQVKNKERSHLNLAAFESLNEINSETTRQSSESSNSFDSKENLSSAAIESLSDFDPKYAEKLIEDEAKKKKKRSEISQNDNLRKDEFINEQNFNQKTFFNNFNEYFKSDFSNLIVNLKSKRDVEAISDFVKILQESIQMINLKLLEKLISTWKNTLVHFRDKSDYSQEQVNQLKLGLADMLDISWDIRHTLLEGSPESSLFEDINWKKKFLENLRHGLELSRL